MKRLNVIYKNSFFLLYAKHALEKDMKFKGEQLGLWKENRDGMGLKVITCVEMIKAHHMQAWKCYREGLCTIKTCYEKSNLSLHDGSAGKRLKAHWSKLDPQNRKDIENLLHTAVLFFSHGCQGLRVPHQYHTNAHV